MMGKKQESMAVPLRVASQLLNKFKVPPLKKLVALSWAWADKLPTYFRITGLSRAGYPPDLHVEPISSQKSI